MRYCTTNLRVGGLHIIWRGGPPHRTRTSTTKTFWIWGLNPERIWQHGNCAAPPLVRDENLRRIRKAGRKRWKQESGYHRRSLAETAMFRFKTIFGPYLQARKLPQQKVEAKVKCAALNRMTHLGMPDSYRVA